MPFFGRDDDEFPFFENDVRRAFFEHHRRYSDKLGRMLDEAISELDFIQSLDPTAFADTLSKHVSQTWPPAHTVSSQAPYDKVMKLQLNSDNATSIDQKPPAQQSVSNPASKLFGYQMSYGQQADNGRVEEVRRYIDTSGQMIQERRRSLDGGVSWSVRELLNPSGQKEQTERFVNMTEAEKDLFDREWQQRSQSRLGRLSWLTGRPENSSSNAGQTTAVGEQVTENSSPKVAQSAAFGQATADNLTLSNRLGFGPSVLLEKMEKERERLIQQQNEFEKQFQSVFGYSPSTNPSNKTNGSQIQASNGSSGSADSWTKWALQKMRII